MKAILMRFVGPIVCASLVGVLAFAGDAAAVTNATPFSAAGCGIVVSGSWSNFVPGPFLVARSQNGAISNPDSTGPHDVTCPMPRVGSSAARLLYVDGNNNGGGSTNCTIFSYSFDGNLLASANTGTLTAASFDTPLSLPAGSIYDYLTLKCSLSTSSRSILRGYVVVE
jgi:hypothetical protein